VPRPQRVEQRPAGRTATTRTDPDHGRDQIDHLVLHSGQIAPGRAVGVPGPRDRLDLLGEARLADPAGPGERDAPPALERGEHRCQVGVPADQWVGGRRWGSQQLPVPVEKRG